MRNRVSAFAAFGISVWIACSTGALGSTCTSSVTDTLHECERIVGSLRPDKAGQMRLFAPDGSEFSATQAQWMRTELARVTDACSRGNDSEAAQRLANVQALLNEHHHAG